MGIESNWISKSADVDNVTIEENGEGQIQIKGGAIDESIMDSDFLDSLSNAVSQNVVLSSDVALTTTLTDISGLSLSVVEAGTYLILADIYFTAEGTDTALGGIFELKKNSTAIQQKSCEDTYSSTNNDSVCFFAVETLAASDVIKLAGREFVNNTAKAGSKIILLKLSNVGTGAYRQFEENETTLITDKKFRCNGSDCYFNRVTIDDEYIFIGGSTPNLGKGFLHLRPDAGKNGFITFTENSVADRMAMGIVAGLDGLVFRKNSATGTIDHMFIENTGSVGIGTTNPSSKAKLELDTTTQGFLPPRMTTDQRNAMGSIPEGLVIYNTTEHALQVKKDTGWYSM